ncbi:hypothetical protein RB195_014067 [Necator americanus]|uniref:Uncharacterized protein n=1 Tax=Necator americanus TaxID=51031 RepID=A0ABR1E168_NECAM
MILITPNSNITVPKFRCFFFEALRKTILFSWGGPEEETHEEEKERNDAEHNGHCLFGHSSGVLSSRRRLG